MFNRVSIGFNRNARWNSMITIARHISHAIPVFVRTRIELVREIVRIGG